MTRERILIAEDQQDLGRMCARALEMAGYSVTSVLDGKDAVERAKKEHFDVFLTDLKMQNVGGLEAWEAIRTFRPDVATVVMTGYGTLDAAIDALRLGVYEFVLKPFRPDELTGAVARALRRKHLEQENARLTALMPLFDISKAFMSSVDIATVPKQVVHIARQEMAGDTASLMLLDRDANLVMHSAEGLPDDAAQSCTPRVGEGTAGKAVAERRPLTVHGDISDDPSALATFGAMNVASAVAVPLIHQEKVVGALNVARVDGGDRFTEGDIEFLALLASEAAVAIENARLFSEIEEAYARLSELDHLKSEFLDIAAHELRSPLAVILAYATLLEEEATGPMQQHLGQVVQSAMQLKSIIDDMVSLQRIDTGQAQIEMTDFDLKTIVADVVDDMRLLIERKEQNLAVDFDPDVPQVRADAQVVHLVLGSLLSNAVKFTPERGNITIRARTVDNRVKVSVADTGIGIPEEELERIFTRFYQVENSLRRKHGGIGLGLAIAREMASVIGAHITVESSVDQGSTFSLFLDPASPP